VTQYQSNSKGHKDKDPSLELSIGQVLAAAGATVLGAVLAKVLNLWGTIPGTAFLSVFSAIGSVLILRAIRRTGDRVKAQIQAMAPRDGAKGTAVTVRLHPESVTATAKIPETGQLKAVKDETVEMPAIDPAPTGHISRTQSRQRTLYAILVSSVLVFGLTVGSLYAFGALTGDPERFVTNSPQTTASQSPTESDAPVETDSPTPSDSTTPSESPSASPTPSESPSTSESPSATETPSESPTTDAGQGGSEAAPSPDPLEDLTESPSNAS
jgi:hypothetical protein